MDNDTDRLPCHADDDHAADWSLFAWAILVLAVGVPPALWRSGRARLGAGLVGTGVRLIDAGDRLMPPAPDPSAEFNDRMLTWLEREIKAHEKGDPA